MTVAILNGMHLNSHRVPRKMVARIGGKRLCDIFFEKMQQMIAETGCHVIVPIHHGDKVLVDRAAAYGIYAPDRSERSRDGEVAADIWHGLTEHLAGYDITLMINPCMPFLPVSEMLEAYDVATRTTKATVAVFQRRNWLWDINQKMLMGGGTPNSKTDPVYYEIARSWISYRTERIGTPGMTEYDQLHVTEPTFCHWDIDTPEQLRVAQTYAEGRVTRTPEGD